METIKGYANYGVLSHEKQTIFTAGEKNTYAKVSEEIEITLPDGWTGAENQAGMPLIISPDGETYKADEILSSYGDNPVLSWYDGAKGHRITLDWKTV